MEKSTKIRKNMHFTILRLFYNTVIKCTLNGFKVSTILHFSITLTPDATCHSYYLNILFSFVFIKTLIP